VRVARTALLFAAAPALIVALLPLRPRESITCTPLSVDSVHATNTRPTVPATTAGNCAVFPLPGMTDGAETAPLS
jgi:hypothetical protein